MASTSTTTGSGSGSASSGGGFGQPGSGGNGGGSGSGSNSGNGFNGKTQNGNSPKVVKRGDCYYALNQQGQRISDCLKNRKAAEAFSRANGESL